MNQDHFPATDKNGIIRALPKELSQVNRKRINKFGSFMFLYDFIQNHWVRQRIHKADPKRHAEIMHGLISPVKNALVLDIGCGTGGAIPYFDSTNDYTGLDLSYAMLKQAIKKARAKGFRRYAFVEGSAEALIFAEESFDFALIDTALHMIPRYQMCIAETARVLKSRGELICGCPTVGISEEFDTAWERIAQKRYLQSLRESDFQSVCSNNGLGYERVDTNGGFLYFRARKVP